MGSFKVSPRELILLLVLGALCSGIGWYYLLFTPLQASYLELQEQLVGAKQQLAERQAMQLRDAQTIEMLGKLQAEQAALQAKFDPISHGRDVIDFVGKVTGSSRLLSLDVRADQIAAVFDVASYNSAKLLLQSLEQSPNFVPLSLEMTPQSVGDGMIMTGFSLRLQSKLVFGQRLAGPAESYQRSSPFGR